MQKKSRIVVILFCIIVMLSGTKTFATEANLPAGLLIGDSDGIHVQGDGEYFIELLDMMPGDIANKTLVIQNMERDGSHYKLSMTATPLTTIGPIDLLNKIHLTLSMDGKVLYDGRVRGDEGVNMIDNALNLGTYENGSTKALQIRLELDKSLPSELFKETSEAEVRWNFVAIKDEISTPPKTGEIVQGTMIAVCAILVMGSISILLFLKKRKEKEDSQQ